jgi:tetratricopeptide (TPR) repeat protein
MIQTVTYVRRENWLVRWRNGLARYWPQALSALALTAAGFAAGWCVARARPRPAAAPAVDVMAAQWNLPALSQAQQAALDDAFAALKDGRYSSAQDKFAALVRAQPLWTALNSDIATVAARQHDEAQLQALIERGERDGSFWAADGKLLEALRLESARKLKAADVSFGEAAAADPSRADIYDQWGDCLLRWGKPAAAAEKFRAALLRNPFPVLEELYRAKIWMAQIQTGQDPAPGGLDKALAAPEPTSAVLFAGAARAMVAGRPAEAAALLERARRVTAPSMYRTLLLNPLFAQDDWRRELKPVYDAAQEMGAQ